VPASFGGRTELRLTARPLSRPDPVAQIALPLLPGEPEKADIELPTKRVHADGVTPYALRVRIADRFGNPIGDARPEVTVEGGSVAAPARFEAGSYVTTYLAPLSRERTTATVAVRAGPAEARALLDLLPATRPLALSPRLGVWTNLSGFTSPVAAFETSLRTDRWGPELAFSADVSYALQNAGGSSAEGITARAHTDWIVAAVGTAWRVPLATSTHGWIGAGPQLTIIVTRTQVGGTPAETGTALVPGAYLAAGVERRFGVFFPFAEVRASVSADPALPNLRGALRVLALTLGYRFELL